jgi:phosphate-selective porin
LALSAAIAWGYPPEVQSYAQVRFTVPQGAGNYFSLRRLKLMIEGDLPDGGHYYVQGIYKDHNRSSTDGQPYLQEAWVRWRLQQGSLTVGQFKPPFGLERFTADWDLDVIDRSVSTDSLIPNGKLDGGKGFARDRGVQWEARSADQRLWGAVGVFEGHGANTNPRGIAPLVATRLVWTVPTEPAMRLRVGGAFSYRDAENLDFSQALPGAATLGYDHFTGRDTRWNLEAAWDGPEGRFRGEYFHARFVPGSRHATRAVRGGVLRASLPSVDAPGGNGTEIRAIRSEQGGERSA